MKITLRKARGIPIGVKASVSFDKKLNNAFASTT